MSTESSSVKKVLILGANGVGKSWILNRLLNQNKLFRSGSGGQPVTKEIKHVPEVCKPVRVPAITPVTNTAN